MATDHQKEMAFDTGKLSKHYLLEVGLGLNDIAD